MVNIFIDILGDPDEEPKEKKAAEPKPDPEGRWDRRLQKQVININGEVVDVL